VRIRLSGRLTAGVAGVALVALGLWAVADRAPRLPADSEHAVTQTEAACLGCHGHAARSPRPAGHPPRDDCYSCHRDSAGVLHPREGAALELEGGWRDDPRR